ncbi:MAG: tRNA uridine-5-carboxymethylaminomethyl(34) synthesis GTPase MnmE [Gammaproteobacteria bacterium]|nr:tRNA uridine-5-carboxymethylaminomethyl(34) synthesis GTPase MnmE [Gammaproteobacteria bacterium]
MTLDADTIVASATPPGTGGIGIVRISGNQAETIARAMLGSLPEPRTATYRTFADARGQTIDAGLALYFPGPASFTGESVLELHGHGGPLVVSMLVDAAIELGARQAMPGEFSERAFHNDKLDLVQAEAIADLIGSSTAQAARAALRSLSGAFSTAVNRLADQLLRLRIHVEAAIDFPEEEIDFLSDDRLNDRLAECALSFETLIEETQQGRVLRDGYQVVIVGKPNAGKSSLMNLLSGQDAAIVTEIAGTTRDILREQIDIDGLAVELIDTAGLRENPDRVEEEGIRRARRALQAADAVLWIQDASDAGCEAIDEELPDGVPVTVVRNKIDLVDEAAGAMSANTVSLSAKTGAGVDVLRDAIKELAGYRNRGEGAFTARRRHLEALARAKVHFDTGRDALRGARAGELLAEELRLSQQALGEITGAVSSDDLLGRIFSEFCIGK